MQHIFYGLIMLSFFAHSASAQTDSARTDALYRFSLEDDVLNLEVQRAEEKEIQAASGKMEKVFDTAIPASIITSDEIRQSGALNVPEALRLSPELIVRQKSNGYYHVQIRSDFQNTAEQDYPNFERTLLLVAINDVPVNDLYQGGVFWETLPVGLNDIKRIEIVRGPHTVLYGPGAATGMINIVTKTANDHRLKVYGEPQAGTYNTFLYRGDASFAISSKLQFKISGYYNTGRRLQDEYYLLDEKRYIVSDSLLFYQGDAIKTNLYTKRALQNLCVNTYAFWQISPDIDMEINLSVQRSSLQSVLQPLKQLALTNRESMTNLLNIRSRVYQMHTRFSYQFGTQDLAVGYQGFKLGTEKLFASAEYDHTGKRYEFKVGSSFQNSMYNNLFDKVSADIAYHDKIIAGRSNVADLGIYLTQNLYFLNRKLRLLTAARGDYLNTTRRLHSSYQLATTYKTGANSMIRASYTKGLQGTFIQDYYHRIDSLNSYEVYYHLNPTAITTYETGYRVKPLNDLSLHLSFFVSNLYDLVQETRNGDLIEKTNSPLTARQQGVSVDIDWSSNKFSFRTFATLQQTNYEEAQRWQKDTTTPGYYGGVSGSYNLFFNKLKINTNLYYYGEHSFANQIPESYIPKETIANLKISYNIFEEHVVYFNARNLIHNQAGEFPYADKVRSMYLIGVNLTF